MYAVIKTGGKQYKVAEGDLLKIEKLEGAVGDSVEFEEVLLVGGDDVKVGTPLVDKAKVKAQIVEQGKDKKILVFHMKRRKTHRKLNGHRQPITRVKITGIEA
jgi:large subunit ribosomal protein L21